MTEESGNLIKHHYLEVNLKKKTVNQYADSQYWLSQGSIYVTFFGKTYTNDISLNG